MLFQYSDFNPNIGNKVNFVSHPVYEKTGTQLLVCNSHQVRIISIRLRDCNAVRVFIFPGHPRSGTEQARIYCIS